MGVSVVQSKLLAQNSETERQESLQNAAKEALANRYVTLDPQPLLTVNSTVSLPAGVGGKLPYSLVYLEDQKQWGIVAYKNSEPTVVKVFSEREIRAAQSNLKNADKEG